MITIPTFNIQPQEWVQDKILSGTRLSQLIQNILHETIQRNAHKPGLATLLVGDNPASHIYVNKKKKEAERIGFHSILQQLPAIAQQDEVMKIIDEWNYDEHIHGILVQLPLPDHLDTSSILQSISQNKDADGFHYINLGKLMGNEAQVTLACTPLGIGVMLNQLGIKKESPKNAVILGRSTVVGKPMANILMDYFDCTVSICHSKTQHVHEFISRADILIIAMGKRHVVVEEHIKENAIVIDVGIHKVDGGKICGDIDYKKALSKVRYITPVPGGVGPMTITMLLYNTYQNYLGRL